MNAPIFRLYALILVLFTLLVAFSSRWAIFEADDLREKTANRRGLIEEQQIRRGTITTVDGTVVAVSEPVAGGGSQRVFLRNYPQGALFGHPVGYSFVDPGQTGIELALDDTLIGRENEFITILDQIRGQAQEGQDVTLTIDAGLQQTAVDALGGQKGSVVALNPQTGAVLAMVSEPSFDPNAVNVSDTLEELNADEENSPLFNRATQATYPPGSTMKVVTAAAALDSGKATPETILSGASGQDFSGVPLANAGGQDFGEIDMTTALTNSVNTYWAQIGEMIGPETLVEYMKRFGFYSDPGVELPDDQLAPSGIINLDFEFVETGFDIARVAIGQGGEEGQLLTTPLQMALVAATIANEGEQMEPTFIQEVADPDGRVTEEIGEGESNGQVIEEDAADDLAAMMTSVAEEGTASGLSLAGGIGFSGKTGTAQINIVENLNQPWFIAFAPVEDPQIAIAVTVEESIGGTGGEVAGPVAIQVMDAALGAG